MPEVPLLDVPLPDVPLSDVPVVVSDVPMEVLSLRPVPEVPLMSVAPPVAELPLLPEPPLPLVEPPVDEPVPDIVSVPVDVELAPVDPLVTFLSDVDDEELLCANVTLLAPNKEMNTANGSFFMLTPNT